MFQNYDPLLPAPEMLLEQEHSKAALAKCPTGAERQVRALLRTFIKVSITFLNLTAQKAARDGPEDETRPCLQAYKHRKVESFKVCPVFYLVVNKIHQPYAISDQKII